MCRQPRADAGEIARALTSAIGQVDAVAALAADLDAPIAARVVALVAVVEAIAVTGGAIPDAIADAIDDLALVDGALAMARAASVCAALHALGPRDELTSTRKRVVRRMIAAGAPGLPLAQLALEIGDRAAGAGIAARDFTARIAPRLAAADPGDAIAGAWARWLARLDDDDAAAVLAARADVAQLLLPHANLAVHARVAWLAAGMLPP